MEGREGQETNEPSVGKEAKTKRLDVDMIVEQECQQRSAGKVPILRPLPLEGFEIGGRCWPMCSRQRGRLA